jgi:aryl-alcohol dehydrogenase-like predicted oxidoreductase
MIPTRNFGKTGVQVSALGLGGHHLAQTRDENESLQIVHEAVDGGITFFDNCWEYHLGLSELLLGKGLTGRRDKVFLMTKVCTHGREKILAMEMLEQSLRRLRTDHLDLWQIHGVSFDNDPDLFIRPNGAAEALEAAKKQGKVRFTGFTGHKDPRLHLKMLATGFPFDAVQMPLNPFDASFRSFEQNVMPQVRERGMAVIGMKPLSGAGEPITLGVVSAEEALRYAMSLPVTTTVTGVDKIDVLRQNLRIAQNFEPMNSAEADALRARCRSMAGDGRFELYKTSIKYDNPQARMAHGFPIDQQSVEVKEMLQATKNDGHPYQTMPAEPK